MPLVSSSFWSWLQCFFFLLRLHCLFLRFPPLLLVRVGFSLLRELSLGSKWKCYRSVVIVAMVVSLLATFKVQHFVAFCWVCVSWSVCVSYKYESSWSIRSIRIKLICKLKLHIRIIWINYDSYGSGWLIWVIRINLSKWYFHPFT